MTEPLRWDDQSGWEIAPRDAWEAGQGELIRRFESAEAAMAFIAKPARNAARVRRWRQRQRENAMALAPLTVPAVVVSALIESGRLSPKAALDPQQVGRELVAVWIEWSRLWGR